MSLRPSAGVIAAAIVIALAGGFFWGRLSKPARVETREKIITKTVEVAAKQKESASEETANVNRRDATRTTEREVIRPDGTVERTSTSERVSSAEAATKRAEQSKETEIVYVDKVVEVEKLRIVEAEKTSWGIAARGGLRAGPGGFVYGAEVSKRLFSSVWIGAWADTSVAGGLMARVEF